METETYEINFRMELNFSIPLTGELLGQFYNWISENGLYSPTTWDDDIENWENVDFESRTGNWLISSKMEIPFENDETDKERKQKIGKFLAWEMEDNQNRLYYELNELQIG